AVGAPSLVVDPRRRRIVAAGRPIHLPPAEFAFYLWFVWQRLEGRDPIPSPNEGAPEAGYASHFLAAYRSLRGPLADLERTERALVGGMTKDYFMQRRARLRRRLEAALGEAAETYHVAALGRRPNTRYALTLDRAAIRFAAAPEAP
ncbi:MAG: TIGR02584 family CRISPR-associated protein, partial [Nitrospirae bacterium]